MKTDVEKQQEYCPTAGLPDYKAANLNATESHIVESSSWVLYFFVFQYLIIVKLILGPLLLSIFAATASKVKNGPYESIHVSWCIVAVGGRDWQHLEVSTLPLGDWLCQSIVFSGANQPFLLPLRGGSIFVQIGGSSMQTQWTVARK